MSSFGLVGLEFYFPRRYVSQSELETHDRVSPGKYTTGLGLTEMAFCHDDEDICSLALTAVDRLLRRYEVPTSSVGFLEVGTETLVDKCKTVKATIVERLLAGQRDVHGTQTVGACYAGTQAILNAVGWLRNYWETRSEIFKILKMTYFKNAFTHLYSRPIRRGGVR